MVWHGLLDRSLRALRPAAPVRACRSALSGSKATASLLILLCLSACTQKHSFRIANPAMTNQFELVSRHGDLVSGILVHLTGRLDGTAFVFLSTSPPQALHGQVDWKLHERLQGSNCVLHYWPENVKSGHLTVDYFFQ